MESVSISVIIPTYNSGRTIARCLDSIIAQTYTDYEVIIMDNSSTDNTLSAIEGYKSKLAAIHVVSESDEGIYDAMNKGIKIASGKWIYFLGSDDYLIDQEVLSKFHQSVSKDKVKYHFVYGNVRSPLYGEKYAGEFNTNTIVKKNICHQAIFYRKEIFDLVGFYNLKYEVVADYEFNLRCFFHKKVKHKYIDLIIAHYSEGGFSAMKMDKVFSAEYPNPSSRAKKFAYKTMSLRELKSHCTSRNEYLLMVIKRVFRTS